MSDFSDQNDSLPTLEDVILAQTDLWGDAAIAQENGPSYEFFEKLLPPIRYVNTTFRHYPIVLGAAGSMRKARYISNGSGVNLSAEGAHGWHDVGFPVTFRVGPREALYGGNLDHLDGPHYADGYLPIVQSTYTDTGCLYSQEAFGGVTRLQSEHGGVLVKFQMDEGFGGEITAHVKSPGQVTLENNILLDQNRHQLIALSGNWKWDPVWRFLKLWITPDRPGFLNIFTEPVLPGIVVKITPEGYQEQKRLCESGWNELIDQGTRVDVPEPIVNNAWKSHIVGNYLQLKDDHMCYSAHNQYEKLYISEGGDAVRGMLLWGHTEDGRRMMPPLLDYTREGLKYHQAGFKLQMIAHYYWLTRDREFIQSQEDQLTLQIERILNHRELESGLFPPERYCGDVAAQVYSLNSNANGWRGLRDIAAVFADLGQTDRSKALLEIATEFRQQILAAVELSENLDTDPPFIPVALFGEEQPYEILTADKNGSYWDLMAPYLIGSGVFGESPDRAGWITEYLQKHGGICMGMIRVRPNMEFWVNKSNVNELYGLRYTIELLRRDNVDDALVSFYGKLAQGMTRDTFLDGEASCLVPADENGRQVFLPPNSAANAYYLWMLRYLLVQDWDTNDDGHPDTLRLLFATPRTWLEDGNTIHISNAPTAFGPVSLDLESRLGKGEIELTIALPERNPDRILLRARVPEGTRVVSAATNGERLEVDSTGTVDLSHASGKINILFGTATVSV